MKTIEEDVSELNIIEKNVSDEKFGIIYDNIIEALETSKL